MSFAGLTAEVVHATVKFVANHVMLLKERFNFPQAPIHAIPGPLESYFSPRCYERFGRGNERAPQLVKFQPVVADFGSCLRSKLPVQVLVRRAARARQGAEAAHLKE